MKFSELVQKLGLAAASNSLQSNRDCDPEIVGVSAVDKATPGTISLIEGEQFAFVAQTAASALILPIDVETRSVSECGLGVSMGGAPRVASLQAQATERNIAWIATNDPRLLFAQAIALFYQPFRPTPAIHPTAVIHPSAQVGEAVYIGAHVTIQARVKIGNEVCIHPNVVIYPDVQIGDRALLHANCIIHEGTGIGADCVIHSGAVIGAEGFGFVPTPKGWFKMEQSGRTVLENGVYLGSNTTIDRAAVGETRVAQNTKIDNLVQIGHSCQVGSDCALAAQVGLAGSSKLGDRVILREQAGVANQVEVGDGAIALPKAGITKDVQPGTTVSGFPAIAHNIFEKAAALYSQLPEIYKSLKDIQRRFGDEG